MALKIIIIIIITLLGTALNQGFVNNLCSHNWLCWIFGWPLGVVGTCIMGVVSWGGLERVGGTTNK